MIAIGKRSRPTYRRGRYADEAPNAKAWRNSFKHGAVVTINERLQDAKRTQEAKAQLTQGAALVLVRQGDALARIEVAKAAEAHGLRERASRVSSGDAFAAGREAAREIDMDAGGKRGLGAGHKRLAG